MWIHLWSIHDGAPPRFVLAVPQFLNSVFLAQLVGPGGQQRGLRLPMIRTFISEDIWCLLFVLQQSASSRKLSNEAEWTWDDSFDTWNFPANQAITFQTPSVLRWSSRWIQRIFFNRHEAINRKPCIRMRTFITFFFAFSVDSLSVSLALQFFFHNV